MSETRVVPVTEDGPHGRYKRIGYDMPGRLDVRAVLGWSAEYISMELEEEDYPEHVLITKDGMSGDWRIWIRRGGAVPEAEPEAGDRK